MTPGRSSRITLDGRHALVTGASKGIGAATAICLAQSGARVTLVARGVDALERAAEAVRESAGVDVHFVAADVTDEVSVDAAFASAEAAIGPVDVLINNAGGARSAPFVKTDATLFDTMMALNLRSTYLCCARAVGSMVERGYGRIVNVASTAGLEGYRFVSAYAAAKHGVVGLTRSLALEVSPDVSVNAVCPGYTDTTMLRKSARRVAEVTGGEVDAVLDAYRAANPSGRLLEPEEVAAVIVALCLDGERRGEAVVVDGSK